ncbi:MULTISPECIES: class I SAM-dependent methyltransferase [unclassified Amycolatopsis]|uniref:SAM-dependent methyltransferase n=1 Tax=unclassified Amycolatopsis TaxID=2618356 RepID=UPI002876905D|nr:MULTISPECIES: class I SAM-dependent methyltransferase [unclassified Amycolatopsis]MDS0139168.1 class I SAM-dependent methyltransferase [Amycolatopsis sp. 505]MDS0144400.1 class I SAM-dependent methyltransferase [Amycolatopsis sp. CM201R]
MSHDHPMTVDAMLKQDFWEAMYQRDEHRIWSGNVNVNLRTEVEGLKPGHALDLGSGEGGDAIWLAKHGWTVDGVDISTTALARAAEAGAEAGVTVNWLHRNILEWRPEAQYDLVSAQYMHLPPDLRRDVFTAAAAAIRPGGSLLVVGHSPKAMRQFDGQKPPEELYFEPEEITGYLGDPWQWVVETCETRGEGHHTDAVYRARRLDA